MFEIAFSFQGRLGRLPFFLGFMALGLATIVGFVVLLAGVGLAAKRHEWAVVVLLGLVACRLTPGTRRRDDAHPSAWRSTEMLDQAAASALFAIVVGGTQGQEALNRQQPLHVEDRGDAFLVVGTPYTQGKLVRHVKCHVFFAKRDAEVLGFGCDGRQILSGAEERDWHRRMTPQQFEAVFGEAFDWERDGVRAEIVALYGGVVNTPVAAVNYAKVLLQTSAGGAMVARGLLAAAERDKVWHITRVPDGKAVLTLSRTTGKLTSSLP